MSLIINIPDLDDSASLLPVLTETVAGFPVPGLQSLYLFEDGAIGSVPTQATDSSGNGAHAQVATGSVITKSAEGVTNGTPSNAGFLIRTPVQLAASASTVLVVRNRIASSTSAYPIVYGKSRNMANDGAATGNSGSLNRSTDGLMLLNYNSSAVPDAPNIQMYAQKSGATSNVAWDNAPAVGMTSLTTSVTPRAQFFTVAVSFNAVTGAIIMRAFGQTFTVTSLADLTTWLTPAGTHVFGSYQFSGGGGSLGDVGLAGFYSGAKDVAGLDVLIAAAKARMALRGVTAL